jgi:hypothetical protein
MQLPAAVVLPSFDVWEVNRRMALSISAVVLLAIIVFLMVKKSGLKGGHAVVCVLLGFYLASSSIAPTIQTLTTNVAGMIGGIKF